MPSKSVNYCNGEHLSLLTGKETNILFLLKKPNLKAIQEIALM